MLFSKLYFAALFAGAFATPIQGDESLGKHHMDGAEHDGSWVGKHGKEGSAVHEPSKIGLGKDDGDGISDTTIYGGGRFVRATDKRDGVSDSAVYKPRHELDKGEEQTMDDSAVYGVEMLWVDGDSKSKVSPAPEHMRARMARGPKAKRSEGKKGEEDDDTTYWVRKN